MNRQTLLLQKATYLKRNNLSISSLSSSPVSRTPDGDVGHRTGFFYDFKAEEMVVRAWDRQEETIRSMEVTQ